MRKYIKYFKFLILIIFFTEPSYSDSQEKEIKKIIIDKPTNERLLSPPIEQKKDAIKLIPPKEIEIIQKLQDEKRKAIQEKRKKEIQDAQRKQDEQRKAIEEKQKKGVYWPSVAASATRGCRLGPEGAACRPRWLNAQKTKYP